MYLPKQLNYFYNKIFVFCCQCIYPLFLRANERRSMAILMQTALRPCLRLSAGNLKAFIYRPSDGGDNRA